MLEQPRRGDLKLVDRLPGSQDYAVVVPLILQTAGLRMRQVIVPDERGLELVIPPGKYDQRYWNEDMSRWVNPRVLRLHISATGEGTYSIEDVSPREIESLEDANQVVRLKRKDRSTVTQNPVVEVSRFLGSHRDLGAPVGKDWFVKSEIQNKGQVPRVQMLLPTPISLSRGHVLVAGVYFEAEEHAQETGERKFGWVQRRLRQTNNH